MEQSPLGEGSDAHIATRLAQAMGAKDEYFVVDRTTEPQIDALGRYIAVSEGLVSDVSAYMDGFDMWRKLFESGVVGAIRGEIPMGWYVVKGPQHGRRAIVPGLADYASDGTRASGDARLDGAGGARSAVCQRFGPRLGRAVCA